MQLCTCGTLYVPIHDIPANHSVAFLPGGGGRGGISMKEVYFSNSSNKKFRLRWDKIVLKCTTDANYCEMFNFSCVSFVPLITGDINSSCIKWNRCFLYFAVSSVLAALREEVERMNCRLKKQRWCVTSASVSSWLSHFEAGALWWWFSQNNNGRKTILWAHDSEMPHLTNCVFSHCWFSSKALSFSKCSMMFSV